MGSLVFFIAFLNVVAYAANVPLRLCTDDTQPSAGNMLDVIAPGQAEYVAGVVYTNCYFPNGIQPGAAAPAEDITSGTMLVENCDLRGIFRVRASLGPGVVITI